MKITPSTEDLEFRVAFEKGDIPPAEFHHRDHLRLAYVYLCEHETKPAFELYRHHVKKFLSDNGVPDDKYHETVTRSWVQAVRHFMEMCGSATSFEEMINNDGRLLDMDIMLTHYRKETLFSDLARREFVQPDLEPIPQY